MLDLHEHLPQGLRVELRKHAAERVIAGRARSPDDVPPPLAIRLDRMQAGASRDQERGHALPDMGRRVQRDTPRVPQPRQENWQIEHLGRIPLKTTHHQRWSFRGRVFPRRARGACLSRSSCSRQDCDTISSSRSISWDDCTHSCTRGSRWGGT